MKRFSVICLQCGLSVNRLIDAETAQTEIYPVPYQQKCKIAPNAADFDCPELERAVERSSVRPIRSVIRSRTLATFRASRWAGGTARMRPYGDPIPFGKRLWPQPSLPMICPMEVAGQMTLKPIFYNSRSTLTICYLYAPWRSQCGLRLHVSC
jgi:hypothetical protein